MSTQTFNCNNLCGETFLDKSELVMCYICCRFFCKNCIEKRNKSIKNCSHGDKNEIGKKIEVSSQFFIFHVNFNGCVFINFFS